MSYIFTQFKVWEKVFGGQRLFTGSSVDMIPKGLLKLVCSSTKLYVFQNPVQRYWDPLFPQYLCTGFGGGYTFVLEHWSEYRVGVPQSNTKGVESRGVWG